MSAPEKEPTPSIDELFASLETIQSQEAILGAEVIAPIVDGVRQKIAAQVPPLSEEQAAILASWGTLLDATAKLGLEQPEPTPEITSALEASNRYDSVIARLGGTSMNPVETTPIAEPVFAEKAPSSRKPRTKKPTPEPDELSSPEPVTENYTETQDPVEPLESPQGTTLETQSQREVMVSNGRKVIKIEGRQREAVEHIMRSLKDSESGSVITATIVRQLVGTTSRQLQLAKKGVIELPDIDIADASRKTRNFYHALKTLRENGIIEHDKGNTLEQGRNPQVGTVKCVNPISITEESDGVLRIETERKPYHVTINQYQQSIANGHGKVEQINQNPEAFSRVATALGAIALRSEAEQAKFTASAIMTWTDTYKRSISSELVRTIESFAGDFPLNHNGIKGGGYFTFENGTIVETVDGWPEKPRFDEPVYVSIRDGALVVTVDGEPHTLIDFEKDRLPGLSEGGMAELKERYKSFFVLLSMVQDRTEVVPANLLSSFLAKDASNKKEMGAIVNWVQSRTRKLNAILREPVINSRTLGGGVLLDLNRRIVVEFGDNDQQEAPTNPIEQAELPESMASSQEQPVEPSAVVTPESTATQPEIDEGTVEAVEPRRSAEAIVADVEQLDDKIKLTMLRRLTQSGRFEYPRSIVEAAHLLKLLTDPEVKAEIREASTRFRYHRDDSEFKNFIAEGLFSCYIRTRSWGSFDELYEAVRAGEIDAEMRSVIRSFERTTRRAIDESTTIIDLQNRPEENTQNRTFAHTAVDFLVDGHIPTPKNPIQAIALLDVFQTNREKIAQNRTNAEFTDMIEEMHRLVGTVIGEGNLLTTMQSRATRRVNGGKRVVLTSSGEESSLARTDEYRFPDNVRRGGRQRRRRKNKK